MRKVLAVLVIAALAFAMAVPVYADAGDKLKGGFEKVVKCPMQVPNNISAEWEAAEFKPFGAVGGLFKGLFYAVWDGATGVIDILTFPIDNEE